jgi:hypothetical protein
MDIITSDAELSTEVLVDVFISRGSLSVSAPGTSEFLTFTNTRVFASEGGKDIVEMSVVKDSTGLEMASDILET